MASTRRQGSCASLAAQPSVAERGNSLVRSVWGPHCDMLRLMRQVRYRILKRRQLEWPMDGHHHEPPFLSRVCSWHKADIPLISRIVRYWGLSGHSADPADMSAIDPKLTCGAHRDGGR